MTLLNSAGFCAEPSDNLKPLLIDLKGWKAEKPEGASINMSGMKMINAIRHYGNGDKNFDVTILVGSSTMIQSQPQAVNVETSDTKVTSSEMDGFNVIQTFDKNENNGYIVINLDKKTTEGSLFMVNYSGISPEEALKIAKKYNWKKIKSVTNRMMD